MSAEEIQRNLRKYEKRYKKALAAALYQEGYKILGAAVLQTPVDKNRLRGSQYISPPIKTDTNMRCELGFGTNYAVYVHERVDIGHTVGNAKFLEIPFRKAKSGFKKRLKLRAAHNVKFNIGVTILAPTRPKDRGDR